MSPAVQSDRGDPRPTSAITMIRAASDDSGRPSTAPSEPWPLRPCATPSWIVSHELSLDEAPDAYEHFDNRDDGWTKVVLHPDGALVG